MYLVDWIKKQFILGESMTIVIHYCWDLGHLLLFYWNAPILVNATRLSIVDCRYCLLFR